MNAINPFQYIIDKDNMTYEELGKLIGTSRQCVWALAKDKAKPSSKMLLMILTLYKDYFKPLDLLMYYHKDEFKK